MIATHRNQKWKLYKVRHHLTGSDVQVWRSRFRGIRLSVQHPRHSHLGPDKFMWRIEKRQVCPTVLREDSVGRIVKVHQLVRIKAGTAASLLGAKIMATKAANVQVFGDLGVELPSLDS